MRAQDIIDAARKMPRQIVDYCKVQWNSVEERNTVQILVSYQDGTQFIFSKPVYPYATVPYFGYYPIVVRENAVDFYHAWDIKRAYPATFYENGTVMFHESKVDYSLSSNDSLRLTLTKAERIMLNRVTGNTEQTPYITDKDKLVLCQIAGGYKEVPVDLSNPRTYYICQYYDLLCSRLTSAVANFRVMQRARPEYNPVAIERSIDHFQPVYRWNAPESTEDQVIFPQLLEVSHPGLNNSVTPQSDYAGRAVTLNVGAKVQAGEIICSEELRPIPRVITGMPYRHTSPNRIPPAASARNQAIKFLVKPQNKIKYLNDLSDSDSVRIEAVTAAIRSIDTFEDRCWLSEDFAERAVAVQEERFIYTDAVIEVEIGEELKEFDRIGRLDQNDNLINPTACRCKVIDIIESKIEHRHKQDPIIQHVIVFQTIRPVRKGDKFTLPNGNKFTVGGIYKTGTIYAETPVGRISIDMLIPAECKKRACVPVEELLGYENIILAGGSELTIDPDNIPNDTLQINNICRLFREKQDTKLARIGYQTVYRLKHIAQAKSKYRSSLWTDYRGRPKSGKGNTRTSGVSYALMEVGANRLLEKFQEDIRNETGVGALLKDTMSCLGYGISAKGFYYHGYFEVPTGTIIHKCIPTQIEEKPLIELNLNSTCIQPGLINGIFKIPKGAFVKRDSRTFDRIKQTDENWQSYITTKDLYVSIPKLLRDDLWMMPDGRCLLPPVCRAIDKVIKTTIVNNEAETPSYVDVTYGTTKSKIHNALNMYWNVIESALAGKDGLLQDCIYPRVKNSFRGVAGAHKWLRIDEAMISVYKFRKMLGSFHEDEFGESIFIQNSIGKYIGYNPDMSNETVINIVNREKRLLVLIIGEPTHRVSNSPAFWLKLSRHRDDTVSVYPGIITMMDRDYDGDELGGIIVEPEYMAELEPMMVENLVKKGYFVPSKQLSIPFTISTIDENDVESEHVTTLREELPLCENAEVMTELMNARFAETEGWDIPVCEIAQRENGDETQTFRWNEVFNQLSDDLISSLALKAGKDYNTIKVGTARVGSLANKLRILARHEGGLELMKATNEFYHLFANTALDAKNGAAYDKVMRIMDLFNQVDETITKTEWISKCEQDKVPAILIDYISRNMFVEVKNDEEQSQWIMKFNIADLVTQKIPSFHVIQGRGKLDINTMTHDDVITRSVRRLI